MGRLHPAIVAVAVLQIIMNNLAFCTVQHTQALNRAAKTMPRVQCKEGKSAVIFLPCNREAGLTVSAFG